jgi:hypothetical protein
MEIVRELDATVMEGLSDEELTGLLETFEMFERRAASARARTKRLFVVNANRDFV